ncbi:MAG: AMP-binding protein [Gammaproteobacteria bacterium]|nr:AMP-binding protein [Gammaproteobacteria bacterium]
MTEYYDALETRDPAARAAAVVAAVAAQVRHAQTHAPGYAKILAGVDARDITSAAAIAQLPVTRKSELAELQRASPPFGGLAATVAGDAAGRDGGDNGDNGDNGENAGAGAGDANRNAAQLKYLFASPGPIYEPATDRRDYWRFARALFAAGFRAGDVAHNAFSYHLTPAGAMGDSGCHALGCAVIPAGTGQTELQVQTIADLRPDGYLGTPSFLKIILEKAAERAADVSSINKALVSGEALPPATRGDFAARGIAALQAYATADLGLVAYESVADAGLIVDEGVYLEIVRPGGGAPVAAGEVGEVVVTPLNPDYPLLRFATGDLSAFMPGPSACGRTNRRIKGWLGRADQTAKVRGMFVHPSQIEQVLQRHPAIARARLVIDWHGERDRMILRCETVAGGAENIDPTLSAAVAATIREICKLRAEVELLAPGELPKDGTVIEDARRYE